MKNTSATWSSKSRPEMFMLIYSFLCALLLNPKFTFVVNTIPFYPPQNPYVWGGRGGGKLKGIILYSVFNQFYSLMHVSCMNLCKLIVIILLPSQLCKIQYCYSTAEYYSALMARQNWRKGFCALLPKCLKLLFWSVLTESEPDIFWC